MRRAAMITLLCVATVAAPAIGRAQVRPRSGWADLVTPRGEEGRRLIRAGLAFLLRAMSPRSPLSPPRHAVLEAALHRFEPAAEILPDDVELAYYTASALSMWTAPSPEGGVERRDADALAAWERVRQLDPEFMEANVAAELAGLHARRGELDRARAEYDRALATHVLEPAWEMDVSYRPSAVERQQARLFQGPSRALIHGNLAEQHMLLGRLELAERHYRASVREAQGSLTRTTSLFGLALTLDRAGDHSAAIEETRRAIQSDPFAGDPRYAALQRRWGPLAALHFEGVFFEPAYEIHAYHALAHEALAEAPDRDRGAEIELALTSWRRFLVEGGTSSRFAASARAHVERLAGLVAQIPPRSETERPRIRSPWGRGPRR